MRLRGSAVLATASALLAISACGGIDPADQSAVLRGAGDGKSAALVIAQGGLGDEAYNDLSYKGFAEASAKYGVAGKPVESKDIVAQGEQILRTAADVGYGLIIDLEFSHASVMADVASDFPDADFAIVNTVVEAPNVTSVVFKEHEGSYLAGVLAALQTQDTSDPKIDPNNKIGFVGGTKSTGIDKFLIGYIQGARSVAPGIEVEVKYANSFGDASKGQQIAKQMYADGTDIIYTVAGGTGAGVIQAAEATNHYAIGVDSNQDALAPGHVLTSMIKFSDVAMADLVKAFSEGTLEGGRTLEFGLADGGVGLSPMEYTKDAIADETIEAVREAERGIVSGEIDVWDVTRRGYPEWA